MASNFAQSSSQYLASIDAEIERLQNLREQVAAAGEGNKNGAEPMKKVARKGMSEEGRLRVAAAQKARWAKLKKAAKVAAKPAPKKAVVKKSSGKKTASKKTVAKTTEPAQK